MPAFPSYFRKSRPASLCLGMGVLAGGLLNGCAQSSSPPPAPPPPLGSSVRAIQQRQMDGALSDRLTIYRHEWADDAETLGEYGTRHLEEIARQAAETGLPIFIERDPDVGLNESRRVAIVRFLTDRHIADADHRVIVGWPSAPGITGDEAVNVYQSRMSDTGNTGGGGSQSRNGN